MSRFSGLRRHLIGLAHPPRQTRQWAPGAEDDASLASSESQQDGDGATAADRPAAVVVGFELPPNLGRKFDVRGLLRRGGVNSRVFRVAPKPSRIRFAAQSRTKAESPEHDAAVLAVPQRSIV